MAKKRATTRADNEKRLGREFIRALSLLYSPDAKSAEKLGLMLQIEIAKRKKLKRPKLRTYQTRSRRREPCVDVVQDECSTRETRPSFSAVEQLAIRDDIPRISIPDHGQNDGAVCKVCNVPEFGPLTLGQCNVCKKYYHPLCHQPPIVDLAVQEPNSLWNCGECGKNNQN